MKSIRRCYSTKLGESNMELFDLAHVHVGDFGIPKQLMMYRVFSINDQVKHVKSAVQVWWINETNKS